MPIIVMHRSTFEIVTCCICATPIALDEDFIRNRRADGSTFWCPNGHANCFRESDVKKLERQLAQERSRHDQTAAAKSAAEREVAAIKKRASLGQCPCCDGKFRNLRNHMQRKHPDFSPAVRPGKK